MSEKYVSIKNLKFLLNEVHQVDEVFNHPYYEDHNSESLELVIDAAQQMGDQYLFPYFTEMDRQEVIYDEGKVKVHHSIPTFMKVMGEGGWIGAPAPYEMGGMQLPAMAVNSIYLILVAANNSSVGYPGLTMGSARLILSFGSEELKQKYIPNMFAGKWQGTMALTEPQAGSSLSDLVTSATPTEEGHYLIKGQKIFISSGDYQDAENVIHLMLARIDGAPAGSKGISLFVVPKYQIDDHGNATSNDVTTAGLFHKMGQKGYATAHLIMGEKDNCKGYLVGEANRGLHQMFQMMNEARIMVGLTGAGIASAAYYASLKYANERPQGRAILEKDPTTPPTMIINHPDVKRMLFLQKAIMEGSISLLMECSKLADMEIISEGEEKENYNLLLELLTPIAKTYPSEDGTRSVSTGLQIFGGYGYCEDFPLEQLYRDIRICALYEGTTGIQSLDLLGRKVVTKNGKALQLLVKEITKTIEEAMTYDELKPYAEILQKEGGRLSSVTQHLIGFAMKGEIEEYIADATIYMDLFSQNILAWQWLKQANKAKQALVTKNVGGEDLDFYESKIHTMKFFFKYELAKCTGLAKILMNPERLTLLKEEANKIIC